MIFTCKCQYTSKVSLSHIWYNRYFGHSAGQSIIRGSKIRHLRKGPVAILMGCSSGSLISQGEFDPDGYIMNFLLGGR